jgi:hypothetical protein
MLRGLQVFNKMMRVFILFLPQMLLADPMKPISFAPGIEKQENFSSFVLQALVIRGESKIAKIGNQAYSIGDSIGSFKIKDISINKLVILHKESNESKELYVGHRWPEQDSFDKSSSEAESSLSLKLELEEPESSTKKEGEEKLLKFKVKDNWKENLFSEKKSELGLFKREEKREFEQLDLIFEKKTEFSEVFPEENSKTQHDFQKFFKRKDAFIQDEEITLESEKFKLEPQAPKKSS